MMIHIDLQFFGGRGATSGGKTGGAGNINVVSTKGLMSAEGKRTEINNVMRAVKKIYDEYGYDLTDVQLATIKGKGGSTLAYYDSKGNLAVNESYFNSKTMDTAYDACVDTGFHPSRGSKSGLEAVTAHELGHKLTDECAKKLGYGDWQLDKVSNDIVKTAKKNGKFNSTGDVRKGISRYGKTSNAEAVAEAFADVYCNGKKASKASQAVVNAMNDILGR